MRKLKPWHYVVFLLAIVAMAYGVYRVVGSGQKADFAQRIYAIDVVTGQVYEFDIGKKIAIFPAKHPETGERTLLPAGPSEPGSDVWVISERYRQMLDEIGRDADAVIDAREGRVRSSGEVIRVD